MAGPLSSARHIQKRDVGRIVWTRDRHSSTFVAGRLVSSLPVGSDLHVSPTRTPESKT
jgi:hypothetical protein